MSDIQVVRFATQIRGQSTPGGILGNYVSDRGLKLFSIERPDLNNQPDISCIPIGKWLALWQWSNKHNRFLYHLQNVPNRTVIELHSANVMEQLLGCSAYGDAIAQFKANSIKPGMPSFDCQGVTNSVDALDKLHKDMQDASGNQMPFYLTIQYL